jgi:integrase
MPETSSFTLFKRSNGTYYILFDQDGRRRWKSTGAKLKTDALKALTKFEQLLTIPPQVTTLASFQKDFLAYAESIYARRTVIIYELTLRYFVTQTGECSLASLNQKHLDDYVTTRLKKGISPVTVNIETRALKAALNTAVRWKLLEANPFARAKQLRVPRKLPVYFSQDDFKKLVLVVEEPWFKELIVFSVGTGMRQGEVLSLRWNSVDLDRKVIHIESAATFRTKQGGRRTIPISDLVWSMLSRKRHHPSCDLIFHFRGRKISESYLTHRFKKAVRLAKLNEDLHWHSLRHTHASWLVQAGVSLYEVQKLLGHSSPTVTEVYSHLQPEHLHGTVNKIRVSMN